MSLGQTRFANEAREPSWSAAWTIILLVIFAALVFLTAHNLQISLPSVSDEFSEWISEGSLRRRIGFVAMGLLGAAALLLTAQPPIRLAPIMSVAAALFVTWATLSLLWATDISLTFRRLLVLWLLAIAAAGLVRAVPRSAIPWFLGLSALAYITIGLGAELVYDTFTPFREGYRFAGSLHPNAQGINCALIVLSGLWFATRPGQRRLGPGLSMAGVGMMFLLLTRSRTSFAACFGAALVLLVLQYRPDRRLVVIVAIVNLSILLGFLYVNGLLNAPLQPFMLGRGTETLETLSMRIPLWRWLVDYIAERPLLGYGYSGFMTSRRAAEIDLLVAFGAAGAHSIYIEVLLGLGAVGLVLFLAALGAGFARGARPRDPLIDREGTLFAAVIAFELLAGTLDSSMIFPSWRFTTLVALAALCVKVLPWAGERGELV